MTDHSGAIRRDLGSWLCLALALSLPMVSGCAQDRYEPAVDLVAGLATAEVVGNESLVRQVGSEELRAGWRRDESRLWGTGEFSLVELPLEGPQPLTLEFRCAPVRSDAPVESLAIRVNGNRIATVALEAAPREYLLTLPAASLRAGRNRIAFAYRGAADRPVAEGALAVEWEYIKLRPLGSRPLAVPGAGEGRAMLYLPYGTRVDYYHELTGETRLALSARHFVTGHPGAFTRASRSDEQGRLDLELQIEGESPRPLGALEAAGEIDLARSEAGLARLSLAAIAPETGRSGGILLVEPRIESVRQARQPPQAAAAVPVAAGVKPNILLYVIDTLRADRLGCYGYARDVSPNIDALAARALVFDRAVAQSSWTKAAMGSVFTGLLPTAHGIQAPEHRLPDQLWTVAEMLRDSGYRTGGFAANGYLSESQGFAQGFDAYFMSSVRSAALHEKALAWLEEDGDRRPFFLYVHTVEPHGPYAPPEPHRTRFAPGVAYETGSTEQLTSIAFGRLPVSARLQSELEALYDAEIASNDAELGRLLDALREKGVYENTLVIVVSDHGEAFFEHGRFGHGNDLYDEVLRVPLIVRVPGRAPGRVTSLAQHVDLLPTLAGAVGVPLERRVHGRDLLADPGREGGSERIAIAHMARTGGRADRPRLSLIRGDWKLIEPLHRPAPPIGAQRGGDRLPPPVRELYHLGRDPAETSNLAGREASLARELAVLARARALSLPARVSESVEFTEEERRNLKALGYLQ